MRRSTRLGLAPSGSRTERGAALVEMAFILPVFALFVFAIIGFGFMFQLRENMTHAAQEALRRSLYAGSIDQQNAAAKSEGRARLTATLGARKADPSAGPPAGLDCSASGMAADGFLDVCTNYVPASGGNASTFPPCVQPNGTPQVGSMCMTVTITYDYGNGPLFPRLPFINDALPSRITVRATGRVQ